VSSIRLFILGSLAQRGPMHGHALLQLAEEEHIGNWTDFAPSGVYGAIKRLAHEELIVEDRVEKLGNYPERSVYRISETGEASLAELRLDGLTEIHVKPDPVDLALTRLDPERLDELAVVIEGRLSRLRATLAAEEAKLAQIGHYLTVAETWAMRHKGFRYRGEIEWHEQLLAALPEIITDEQQQQQQQQPSKGQHR
jgi:DNA-binding PadR family transcriptional regulator